MSLQGALYWPWMQKGYDQYDRIMQGDRAEIDKMVLRKTERRTKMASLQKKSAVWSVP